MQRAVKRDFYCTAYTYCKECGISMGTLEAPLLRYQRSTTCFLLFKLMARCTRPFFCEGSCAAPAHACCCLHLC